MLSTALQLKVTVLTVLFAMPVTGRVNTNDFPVTPACLQLNTPRLMHDLATLSSDAFAGRKPGTAGHAKATGYLAARFDALNLLAFDGGFVHPFIFEHDQTGSNIIGYLEGRHAPHRYFIITAHYDHLGRRGSRTYNGADDNASGVAALLALAEHFRQFPPHHSLIFVATDAEEPGLHGAYALLRDLPVAHSSVALNINIDMIGQGGYRDQLYLVHDGKHSHLETVLQQTRARASVHHVRLSLRNARSRLSRLTRNKRIDWRDASDYAVFAKYAIPFVHIGTDTHQDYHTPNDTLNNIDSAFFTTSAGIARCVVEAFDREPELLQSTTP